MIATTSVARDRSIEVPVRILASEQLQAHAGSRFGPHRSPVVTQAVETVPVHAGTGTDAGSAPTYIGFTGLQAEPRLRRLASGASGSAG
ncbi:unnamed protein product [marine sediment metagenome]|uniref:Uncharacterized protein n=1 Tax=marine sediment metagenome TaxID=412755 RepID=X0UYD9_9ZZZZ